MDGFFGDGAAGGDLGASGRPPPMAEPTARAAASPEPETKSALSAT